MIKTEDASLCLELMESENGLDFFNMENSDGKLPIFVAIDILNLEIIEDMILESLTMNLKDHDGISPMVHMLRIINKEQKELAPVWFTNSNDTPRITFPLQERRIRDLMLVVKMLILRGVLIKDVVDELDDEDIQDELIYYFYRQSTVFNCVQVDKKVWKFVIWLAS